MGESYPGRNLASRGHDASQTGNLQEVTSAAPGDLGTIRDLADTSRGRSENTTRAQPEHNRSTTADALPPDLAKVMAAWPRLSKPIRAAILALVGTWRHK